MCLVRQALKHLKIETQTNCHSRFRLRCQKTVIKTFAIAKTIAAQIKSDARNYDQIKIDKICSCSTPPGLTDSESPNLEIGTTGNSIKNQRITNNPRQKQLALFHPALINELIGVDFAADRTITRYFLCTLKKILNDKTIKNLTTEQSMVGRIKLLTLLKSSLTNGLFVHSRHNPAASAKRRNI